MNHDEMIAVIQAHKDGKQVQARSNDQYCASGWQDISSKPLWNFDRYEYRIKPEERKPREWKLVVGPDNAVISAHNAAISEFFLGAKAIHVREVLE